MAVEYYVKRTIYVAKCSVCEEVVEVAENPPRERYCSACKVWVPYQEVSYTGPSLDKTK